MARRTYVIRKRERRCRCNFTYVTSPLTGIEREIYINEIWPVELPSISPSDVVPISQRVSYEKRSPLTLLSVPVRRRKRKFRRAKERIFLKPGQPPSIPQSKGWPAIHYLRRTSAQVDIYRVNFNSIWARDLVGLFVAADIRGHFGTAVDLLGGEAPLWNGVEIGWDLEPTFVGNDSGGYIQIHDDPRMNFGANEPFTFIVKFRTTDTRGNLVSFRDQTNDNSLIDLSVGMSSASNVRDGEFLWYVRSDDGTGATNNGSGPVVNDGKWHEVVLVGDPTNNECRYYVDGKRYGAITRTSWNPITTSGYRSILLERRWFETGYTTTANASLNGEISFVAIYKRAFTDDEVSSFYQQTSSGFADLAVKVQNRKHFPVSPGVPADARQPGTFVNSNTIGFSFRRLTRRMVPINIDLAGLWVFNTNNYADIGPYRLETSLVGSPRQDLGDGQPGIKLSDNNVVRITNNDHLKFGSGQPFTILARVYLTASKTYQAIYGFRNSGNSSVILLYLYNNQPTVDLFEDGRTNILTASFGPSLQLNRWYLIGVRRNPDGTIDGFVDDQVYANLGTLSGPLTDMNVDAYIGRHSYNLSQDLNGLVSFVTVHRRAIHDEEVKTIYENTKVGRFGIFAKPSSGLGSTFAKVSAPAQTKSQILMDYAYETRKPESLLFLEVAHPLVRGLYTFWPLATAVGSKAYDIGPRRIHGEYTYQTFPVNARVITKEGIAFYGDGAYSSIVFNGFSLFSQGDLTYTVRFRVEAPGNYAFSEYDSATNAKASIGTNTSGNPVFEIFDEFGNVVLSLVGSSNINDNDFHTVSVTRKGDKFTLYVDGKAEASTTNAVSMTTDTAAFGFSPDPFGGPGYQSVTVLWAITHKRALNDLEIKELHPNPWHILRASMRNLSRGTVWSVLVSDIIRVQDFIGRGTESTRAVSESIRLADAIARKVEYTRSSYDQINLVDVAATRLVEYSRQSSDIIRVPDAATRDIIYDRSVLDSIQLTDAVVRDAELYRAALDGIGVFDTIIRQAETSRQAADLINLADSLIRQVVYKRVFADQINISDAASRDIVYNRVVSDIIQLVDSVTGGLLTKSGFVSDVINVADSGTTRTVEYSRAPKDFIGVFDFSSTRSVEYDRAVSQALGISDSIFRLVHYNRSILENLGISDTTFRRAELLRSVVEFIDVIDSIQRTTIFYRSASDFIGITDTLKRRVDFARLVLDSVLIADAIARAAESDRATQDNILVADLSTRITETYRSLLDFINVLDSQVVGDTEGPIKRQVSDIIRVTDFITRQAEANRNVLDLINAVDSIIKRMGFFYRTTGDSVIVSDAIGRGSEVKRSTADLINVVDVDVTRTTESKRFVFDAIGLLDLASRIAEFNRSVSDNIQVGEGISKGGDVARQVADIIKVIDYANRDVETYRSLYDQINVVDGLLKRTATVTRALLEIINVVDTKISRGTEVYRKALDFLGIRDQKISRPGTTFDRFLGADLINVVDLGATGQKTTPLAKLVSDAILVQDTVSRPGYDFRRDVGDLIKVADIVERAVNYTRSKSDLINLIDQHSREIEFGRSFLDIINVIDVDASRIHAPYRALKDIILVHEFLFMWVNYVRFILDGIYVVDRGAQRVSEYVRKELDRIGVKDFLNKVSEYFRTTIDMIKIIDRGAVSRKDVGRNLTDIIYVADQNIKVVLEFGRKILENILVKDLGETRSIIYDRNPADLILVNDGLLSHAAEMWRNPADGILVDVAGLFRQVDMYRYIMDDVNVIDALIKVMKEALQKVRDDIRVIGYISRALDVFRKSQDSIKIAESISWKLAKLYMRSLLDKIRIIDAKIKGEASSPIIAGKIDRLIVADAGAVRECTYRRLITEIVGIDDTFPKGQLTAQWFWNFIVTRSKAGYRDRENRW